MHFDLTKDTFIVTRYLDQNLFHSVKVAKNNLLFPKANYLIMLGIVTRLNLLLTLY